MALTPDGEVINLGLYILEHISPATLQEKKNRILNENKTILAYTYLNTVLLLTILERYRPLPGVCMGSRRAW